MQKRAVQTPVGRVEFETAVCDGCGTESVPAETVNWFKLVAQGPQLPVMGPPSLVDTTWCGLPCLMANWGGQPTEPVGGPLGGNDPQLQ